MPEDPFGGRALQCWVGKAQDHEIHSNGQSGGIATALLIDSLDVGLIRGAVVVTMGSGLPPRPDVRIATTRLQLQESQKSKYCPVPLLRVFKELEAFSGPVAVVGIPCQIHGLLNLLSQAPRLKEKVALTVGLVCDRIMTYAAIDYLALKAGVQPGKPYRLEYRDKSVRGYPGDVSVRQEGRPVRSLHYSERTRIKEHFTPLRCRLCFDKMNVLADITVGDPHGIPGVDSSKGESLVVARTTRGLEAVQGLLVRGRAEMRIASYQLALAGQDIPTKKASWQRYCDEWTQQGKQLPRHWESVRGGLAGQPPRKFIPKESLRSSIRLRDVESREGLLALVTRKERSRRLGRLLAYNWVARLVRQLRRTQH